ncbi:hypothetical protein C1645_836996 [Glomus cerebriforme]|uniref:Uncharacterized protein n=1 Tax=Glomus cerebriforme TaxID=658196 RepID=A0A397S9G3_9GLOM|nr:hypothetical protein C1645_836996 [Glomus cerebriforme]
MSFTSHIIKSIVNFIVHQFNIEALSFNESLISKNLIEFEEIIYSQAINLKYLKIGRKFKNFMRILKVLRNCINLELLEFENEKIIMGNYTEDYMQGVEIWDFCNYDLEENNCEKINEIGEISIIKDFDFNQLKIKLTYLLCELPLKDFLLFIKLLEVLKELEHLKLKLKLSSIINDNYIVTFANSLSNSLQKLGLDIYNDDEGNDLISYFLVKLLENLNCNNLFKIDFYNNQMISNNNLRLILQFALNRNGFVNYGGDDDGKFKLFKYVEKNFTEDFDHDLLQKG